MIGLIIFFVHEVAPFSSDHNWRILNCPPAHDRFSRK
jgi:hypothetical protein